MKAISLHIAGADFPNKRGDPARRFEIALCRPGDRVELVPEPKNRHDPRAILILSERGVPMGYVTAERAPLIGKLMAEAAEVRAVFQAATATGGIVRVAFDGAVPLPLPPSGPPAPPVPPDFWPDPLWDDD